MDYSETVGLFPPRKKIRPEQNLSEYFSSEELAGILSTCSYKQHLKVFNQELDLLDDISTNCTGEKTENVGLAHRSPDIHSIFIPHFKQEVVLRGAQGSEKPKSEDVTICSYPEIALDAKREASVLQQVSKLHRKGLWSSDRLPKVMEPKCEAFHHTHLLNEAIWLSVDFREEFKWKKYMASKLARAAQIYLITRHEWNQQLQRFEEHLRMRNAARVAKMVKDWWGSIGQDLDLVSIQTSRERWDYAYEKNQDWISFFSDMGPSWLAAVKFDLEDKKLHEFPDVSHDRRILSYINGDGDSDDKDWRPDVEGECFIGLDSCSQSTSSSLAASFVDDSDMSSFGVAVCSPSDHVPLGYHPEHSSPLCTKACNHKNKHPRLDKRRKSQSEQSYISECGDQDDPYEESHSIILETRLSSNSPESCNQSVESSEVQGLISDMEIPLDRLLESYFDQRWYIQNRVTSRPRFHSSGSDISNCEVERRSLNRVPQHIQNEISILQNEASMPLHEILPSGYMDYLSSVEAQKSLTTRSPQVPSQSNYQMGGSSGFSSKTDGGDAFLSMINNNLSLNSVDGDLMQIDSVSSRSSGSSSLLDHDHSECDNLLPPKIRFRTNSRMVFAPWYSLNPPVSSHLGELHTSALELLPLKLPSMAGTDSSHLISEVRTLAYSPTLRIPYFPTPNLGAAVSWIRHAFARSVPALLLTNSHLSGDAELAVAAHLGQLAAANPRYYLPSESFPSEFRSNRIMGEWGPHLIITPRLCLPAWRKRLQMWCPGLRVVCLGLTRKSEPSGTGHLLRENVAQGTVNICLVSYAALRSKPSRFSRIQWSSVIFDQIQHIILQSHKYTNLVHIDSTSCQQAIHKVNSQNCARNPPVHCETDSSRENITAVNVRQIIDHWSPDSSKTLDRRKSEWFDLILNRFGRNGHRLLICSSSDLIYHKHSPYLLDLSKLLLLKDLPNDENYDSWLNDFFQTVCQSSSHRHCSPNSCLLTKPSKKQLLKFLDPFVIRFDDEDDWDSFINDEVIECHMSSIQQKLHDSILSTKAAENAMKTGNLLDLLQTVSVASRACSHPALAGTHPRSSRIFRHTLHNLQTRSSVLHGPYVFKSFQKIRDVNNICYSNGGGLFFNTPESVLRGVKLLRHSELSDTTYQMFNLFEALKPSAYIRNRIATLTLQFNQLLSPNNHSGLNSNRNVPASNIVSNSINSPVSRLPNGNLGRNYSRYGNQLTNGILLPQHCSSENCIDPDIEIVSIPQRQKRPRESIAELNSVYYKRRRVEEYDTHRPFLDYMDIGSSSGCHEDSINWSPSRLPLSNSDPYMAHSDQFRSATNTVTYNFCNSNEHSNNTTLNENTYPWLKDNTRKCTQLIGFSDWCSQDTCNLLRFDVQAFSTTDDYIANSKNTPTDLWNIVMDQFTQWTDTSILCTRSRVIATPARLVSRIGPIDPGLLENKKTFPLLSDIYCPHSFLSFCIDSRILSHVNHIFYPLTERARLLAPTSCSNVGFHSSLSCISNSKSPISQLFKDSGKFYHLHQKLTDLLGVKSNNQKRPRCIYFIAHHTAFLDLLNAYLSTSWRLFHRVRIPSSYKTVNANTCSLIDRINNWPHGIVGPLLVLIHARSPATSLVSLRADSNIHIIICDADWRAEVTDNLKAVIHSWVLNGLSTSCVSTCYNNSSHHKVNTYRLLSTGDFGYPANRLSVEACLLRGVACRLLPRAVFHAHSTTHVNRHSLLFARVQPNVVNGLLSGVHTRKLTHRSLTQKIKSNEFERLDLFNDRNFFGPINKQDTLSHSSASSIASSFSYMGTESRLDEFGNEKIVGEEEEVLLFQEREPLSELLLHQALELFEDPIDTQAWCCTNAEKVAIANEFISEDDCNDDEMGDFCSTDDNVFDLGDDGDFNWELSNELETSNFLQSSEYNDSVKSYQYRLMKQLGYTDLIGWEVATYELLNRISVLESQLSESNNDWLSYHYPVNDNLMVEQNEQQLQHIQSASEMISSYSHFSQLPIWCPFESHQKYMRSFSDISESISFLKDEPNLPLSVEDSSDWISSNFEYDLGYEAVPMTESELPPLIIPSVMQNNDNNVVVDRKSARRRPCINHSSLSSRPLNNDVSSYRNVTSRLSSKNLKRRALSSSAHSVSHHINSSCSNNILDGSATTYTATGPNFAPIENDTRSQDNRIIGSLPHSRDPSSNGTSIPSSIASANNNTVPLSSVSSSSNVYSNNAIVLSLHSYGCNASGNLTTLKLHIPRVSYNKAVTNARIHRLRRMNANIGPGSDTAAVALAAGAHLLQQQQQHLSTSNLFPEHNQHLMNAAVVAAAAGFSPWNSVTSNPTILARYGGHTSFCHSGSVNSSSTRHLPSSLQNYMQATNTTQYSSLKYPVSGSSSLPVNNNSSTSNNTAATQIANQLYVGKPLEWLIYEEAALYLCITKLQELNFEINNSSSSLSTPSTPNYRFAEFFLNNYLLCRSYRGARQCLLAHFKMQNVFSSANTVAASSTSSTGVVGGGYPLNNSPFAFSPEDIISHSASLNMSSSLQQHHGPSSRKVKNKMKSAAVAAAAAAAASSSSLLSGMSSGGGSSQFFNTGNGGSGSMFGSANSPNSCVSSATSAASATAALNRCRGYLFYQHLQTWLNLTTLNTNNTSHANMTTDSSSNISTHLSPILHAIKFAEDSQASVLRKAIRDTLSTPSVQIPPIYRSSGSRRTCVVGSCGVGGGSTSSALGYHSNAHATSISGSSTSSSHYAHHSSSGSGQHSHGLLTGHSATVSNTTTPALLTHHRHRHHHITYDHGQSHTSNVPTSTDSTMIVGSLGNLNSATGSSASVVHSGPIIQKNPTHIAALQEHNINPDTLITPAMVIKNKEEREARQRAETLSTINQANSTSTTSTTSHISSSLTTSTSGIFQGDSLSSSSSDVSNTQHSENVCLHSNISHTSSLSSDHVYKTSTHYLSSNLSNNSGDPTTLYNLHGCSTTSSLPTASFSSGRTNAQLSFAHNLSHRGSSVMLPIRSGFNTNTITPSGSILSFTGQQQHHRLLGAQNTSSPTGHYQFQPRQTLLHSSIGRLTHLTPGSPISNTSQPTGTHVLSSGAATASSSTDDGCSNTRSVDLTSGSILIPGNWRTATNPRSLNVQTIVSSTPTVLRRSATFTGVSLSNQSTSGLQTCRLNPATSNISQSLSSSPTFTGTYMNTQVAKIPYSSSSTGQSNFYIHQRPQFLSSTHTTGSSSPRNVFTPPSNIAVVPSASNNFSSSVTHLPQILRPRNALRGSVVQPTFVRTISPAGSGTGGSVIPVSGTQYGARLSPNIGGSSGGGGISSSTSMFLGRVTTLTVSSNNPSVSSILNSRTGTQHSISPTVFQSLRTCISGGITNPSGNEQSHLTSQNNNNISGGNSKS